MRRLFAPLMLSFALIARGCSPAADLVRLAFPEPLVLAMLGIGLLGAMSKTRR